MATTLSRIQSHILRQLSRHRNAHLPRPLFIAFQGPQGSGKTYLSSLLRSELACAPHNVNAVTLSIDDLYLPHDDLAKLANKGNRLLKGRGMPGTHDIALGSRILKDLWGINDVDGGGQKREVRIPIFDKSLHSGEGDRTPEDEWSVVEKPVDVVVLEGWCVGFYPIGVEEVARRFEEVQKGSLGGGFEYGIDEMQEINQMLERYLNWWDFFDVFVQIKPSGPEHNYNMVYKWRLEQEHYMKATNGGKGMSDAEVIRFVDRYIPGYIFFLEGITRGYRGSQTNVERLGNGQEKRRGTPKWIGKGLRVVVGEEREVLDVVEF